MMVITAQVTQACNDKREVVPALEQIATLPHTLVQVHTRVADHGYFSQANTAVCAQAGLELPLTIKRESSHEPAMVRFAPDPEAPQATAPLGQMVHRPATQADEALYKLRKQTVEPVFGIIKQHPSCVLHLHWGTSPTDSW
jgi:hypothetical protein